jgi:beta-aspartyl-peptidase (threonine type)
MADAPVPPSDVQAKFESDLHFVNWAFFVALVFIVAVTAPIVIRALGYGEKPAEKTVVLNISKSDDAQIREVLIAQTKAWNKGDLEGFMGGYWRDANLTFISGDNITKGWDATKARYQAKYFTPDKNGKFPDRGELSFSDLEIEGFSPESALVRGRFSLKLPTSTATGRFTLVFRKLAHGWRITSDHTSAADPPEKKK